MSVDEQVSINWDVAKVWSEQFRYRLDVSEQDARSIVQAVIQPETGVLQWLMIQ